MSTMATILIAAALIKFGALAIGLMAERIFHKEDTEPYRHLDDFDGDDHHYRHLR